MTLRSRMRGGIANALLFSASVTVGFYGLELGARILAAERRDVTTGEQSVYNQFDPVLGWRNRPHARVQYNRREYSTDVSINALGFRDVERQTSRVPGLGRVLVLGDSFVEAYSVDLDESVTRRAEALSRAQGCGLEVLNAGVHAWSTDQEALWYQEEAEPLNPDVVLIFVYYNDILNNVRPNYWGMSKPVTEVREGRIVPVNLPLPITAAAVELPAVRKQPPARVRGSVLKTMIEERLRAGAPRLYDALGFAGLWTGGGDPDVIPDELRAYRMHGRAAGFDAAWDRTASLLSALADLIRARGADPVLVYVPARFEISERDWDLTLERYGMNRDRWDLARVRASLEEIAVPARWGFLDLTAPLRESTDFFRGGPYFRHDGHWNRLGHDVAARSVVAFLRERALLPCGGRGTPSASRNP